MKYVVMLLVSLFFAFSLPGTGRAETNINVNIGSPAQPAQGPEPEYYDDEPLMPLYEDDDGRPYEEPPPLGFDREPDMVVVPSGERYVYMVPNYPGIYFYGGYWYRHHRGYWYRSSVYNRGWGYVGASYVPRYVRDVPPEYVTYLPPNYHRIHYREFNQGWRGWERNHHWHNQEWYKHERRDDVRRERYGHIRTERDKMRHDSGNRDHDRIRRDDGRRDRDKGSGHDRDRYKGTDRDRDRTKGSGRDDGRTKGTEGRKEPGRDRDDRYKGTDRDRTKGSGRDDSRMKGTEGRKEPGRDRDDRYKGTDRDRTKGSGRDDSRTRAAEDERKKRGETEIPPK